MIAQIRCLGAVLALLLLACGALPAGAQQPTRVNPTESSVKEQQLLDALKPGSTPAVTGRISIPDSRAGSLIQPAGRDWQAWRQRTLPWLGAVSIVGMVVVLLGFLAIHGRVRVDAGLSGQQVQRFGGFERFVHWLTATAFVVLGLTGLNVTFGRSTLLPLMGADAFTTWSQLAKYLHNYMSFAFVIGLVAMFLQWVMYNFPMPSDFRWIAQGGGIFGHKHPPAGRFNAGQKLMFWVVIIGGAALSLTGFALLFPFYAAPGALAPYTATMGGIQTMSMLHGAIAVVMIAVIIAHIYIGTIGMQGAFWSMGSGNVDANWARQHHSIWAERVLGKAEASAKPTAAE